MTSKTPPSLHSLIDKHARLDAEIRKTQASLATVKILIEELLSSLEDELSAIDRTLALHNIQIDVGNIAAIRSQYVRMNLPYGELTRSILLCLRL